VRVKEAYVSLRERECFERFDLEESLSLSCRHIRTHSLSLSLSLPLSPSQEVLWGGLG